MSFSKVRTPSLSDSTPETEKYHNQKEWLATAENSDTPKKNPNTPHFLCSVWASSTATNTFQKYSECLPSLKMEQLSCGKNAASNMMVLTDTNCP